MNDNLTKLVTLTSGSCLKKLECVDSDQPGTPSLGSNGFTLLELMIVVLLVGILSTIATANYRKFSARARQTEAKIALAAVYLAEMSFFADQTSFTQCLSQSGYAPIAGSVRYYMVGYMAPADHSCGPSGTGPCDAYAWNPDRPCLSSCFAFDSGTGDATIQATAKISSSAILVNSCATQTAAGVPANWTAFGRTFLAGAFGNISPSNIYDQWAIDETKTLTNISSGI